MLEDMYVIEGLHGWDAPVRAKSRLRTKPKRYFADPSIPAAALGMTTVWIANDAPWAHGGPPMPDDGEDHIHHVAEAVAAFLHSIEIGDHA